MGISYSEFKRKQKEAFESGRKRQHVEDLKKFSEYEAKLLKQYNDEKNRIKESHAKEIKGIHDRYKQILLSENQKQVKKYKKVIKSKNDYINELKDNIREIQKINKKYKLAVDMTFDMRHKLIGTMERLKHLHERVLGSSTDIYQAFSKISDELEAGNDVFSKSESKIREIMLLEESHSVAGLTIVEKEK